MACHDWLVLCAIQSRFAELSSQLGEFRVQEALRLREEAKAKAIADAEAAIKESLEVLTDIPVEAEQPVINEDLASVANVESQASPNLATQET